MGELSKLLKTIIGGCHLLSQELDVALNIKNQQMVTSNINRITSVIKDQHVYFSAAERAIHIMLPEVVISFAERAIIIIIYRQEGHDHIICREGHHFHAITKNH